MPDQNKFVYGISNCTIFIHLERPLTWFSRYVKGYISESLCLGGTFPGGYMSGGICPGVLFSWGLCPGGGVNVGP